MVKLSEKSKDIIAFAIKYCNLVDIKSLMIDKHGIRAKQDEKAVYLIEPGNFDFLEFDTLYINRVQSLYPRFNMFEKSKIPYELYADIKTLDDETTIVSKLRLKGERTSVSFNTSILTEKGLPKKFKKPIFYSFNIKSDDLRLLNSGISAMGAKELKFYTTESGTVNCEITDIEQDVLTQELTDSYKIIDTNAPESFSVKYNFKIIFPLLNESGKEKEKIKIQISEKGIMLLKINGLSMYIFPET